MGKFFQQYQRLREAKYLSLLNKMALYIILFMMILNQPMKSTMMLKLTK